MIAGTIAGATRVLGAPKGWNATKDGPCHGLPIVETRTERGQACMVSAWIPSPEELERLNAGAMIELCVMGIVHPPVGMSVGAVPTPPAPSKDPGQ